jgi:hypothetical protein
MRKWVRDDAPPHWGEFYDWGELVRIVAKVGASDDASAFERAMRDTPVTSFSYVQAEREARSDRRPWPHRKSELASSVVSVAISLVGARWASPPSGADFAPERAALEACATATKKRFAIDATFAVDDKGATVRCESTPASSCVCAALTRHRFAPGAANRRARVHVARAPTPGNPLDRPLKPRSLPEVSVGFTGPPGDWETTDALDSIDAKLAKCFQPATPTRSDELALEVFRDDGGNVIDVAFSNADWLAKTERACIDAATRAIPLPCPLDEASRRVGISVTARR